MASEPPDAEVASICASVYGYDAPPDKDFTHYDEGRDDGVCWALKRLVGFDVIAFRGSITPWDWLCDFRALAIPSRVGVVHAGFLAGLEHALSDISPLIRQPIIITGHSLGAARAAIMAGLMLKEGMTVVSRVVFGEPKPGFMDFAETIESVPGRSYRNGDDRHHDLVTDVPFSFPPMQYVHPTPVIPVSAQPSGKGFEKWGAFAWHHMQLYQAAMAAKA